MLVTRPLRFSSRTEWHSVEFIGRAIVKINTILGAILTMFAGPLPGQDGLAGITELVADPDRPVAYGLIPENGRSSKSNWMG